MCIEMCEHLLWTALGRIARRSGLAGIILIDKVQIWEDGGVEGQLSGGNSMHKGVELGIPMLYFGTNVLY